MTKRPLSRPPLYRIFLTHNFDPTEHFVRRAALQEGVRHRCEILTATGGSGAQGPAELVRERMMTAEGLLVVLRRETSWASSEIGMAFAFRIPIFVIADPGVPLDGFIRYVTSILPAETANPKSLASGLSQAFNALTQAIDASRGQLAEPPRADRPGEIVSWQRYQDLVKQAHGQIERRDPEPGQEGFKPTLILGISRGGIIAADMLSRMSGDRALGLLEADRSSASAQVLYADEPTRTLLARHLASLGSRQARILIVDDVVKSGRSLAAARQKVRSLLAELRLPGSGASPEVRTLVLVVCGQPVPGQVDYPILVTEEGRNILLPYGLG